MGSNCAVAECRNYSRKTRKQGLPIIYHNFPKDPVRCKEWVVKCKRPDNFNANHTHVCSDHFDENDYVDDMRNRLLGLPPRKILKPTAVPKLKLSHGESANVNEVTERSHRLEKRRIRSNALERLKNLSPKREKEVECIQESSTVEEIKNLFYKKRKNGCVKEVEHIEEDENTRILEENRKLLKQVQELKEEKRKIAKRNSRYKKYLNRDRTAIKEMKKELHNLNKLLRLYRKHFDFDKDKNKRTKKTIEKLQTIAEEKR